MIPRRTFLMWVGAAVSVGCGPAAPTTPGSPVRVTKGPWVHALDTSRVSLRFETREDLDVPVVLTMDGQEQVVVPRRETDALTWAWGLATSEIPVDEPGDHTLHEVVIVGLRAGRTLQWRIEPEEGVVLEGFFRAPPLADAEVVVGWIADTMAPYSTDVAEMLAQVEPQLVIHGGDLQYLANPADTWNGLFSTLAPLHRMALFHAAYGNHESDTEVEPGEMFDRLFRGQGDRTTRWHRVSFGPVAVIVLDSEDGALDLPDQLNFLDTELDAALGEGREPIVVFHRPTYTFSKHSPNLSVRAAIHSRVVGRCKLVLCGHVHGYEHFLVEGVHYVIDGGGGAFTYDLDEEKTLIEAERPDEIALRVMASRTYGGLWIRAGAGGIEVERRSSDGEVVERFAVA
jgi:predicted phosphodiesterase